MPMWAPPTPPHDDNDIYIDQTCFFLYEPHIMPESQLPPIYVKKERKKPKIETITTRKQKQRKEEQPRVPRSLFDRPTSALLKMRREAKLKHGLLKPFRPVPQVVNKPTIDPAQDQPEWLIHEDWALLQAVQSLFDVPLNLMVISPAHQPNWDLVADVVNCCSRVYRSAKQCKYRYENVVIPREEGRILYDMNPKKQSKKTKGIYKTKNNRPMRTSQLFVQDNNNAVTMLHSLRFDSSKSIAGKRPPTLKQTLVNPTLKNPKHATVLSENGINYDTPLHPMQVAEIRAQRIQREKKQNQAAAQANAEQQLATQRLQQQAQQQTQQPQVQIQQTVQPTTPQPQAQQTAVSAATVATVAQVSQPQLQPIGTVASTTVLPVGTIAKSAVGQTVTAVSLSRATTVGGNIVLNAQGGVATNFAAINRRMSQQATANIAQPATVTVTGTLNPAVRAAQRTVTGTPLTIQEITAIGTQAPGQVAHITTGQVARTQIQTTVATTFTGQLAVTQRIATPTTVTAGTVQQQITQPTATKTLTPQQLLTLQQQQTLLKHRALQQQQQQQQFRMQKLNLTADQIRQQQIKQIQGRAVAGQKVITQQLVSSIGGIVPKQTQVKPAATLPRPLTQEELNRLKQQQQLAQKTQIPTTQIIQAQVQQLTQPASIATSGTTLVKTVSAPGGGVPIPVSTVNINVSVPQQKTGIAKQATVSQLQQIQRMQILNKQQRLQTPQKITAIGQQVGKTQSIPLNTLQIIQQQPGTSGQLVQLQQIMKQQKPGNFIMTQPIIATVTQSQTPAQIVTKVLATSATTSQIQTITPTATTVTLPPATAVMSPAQPVATISVAPATIPVTKVAAVATVTHEPVTTVQVQPVPTATTQTRIATLTQSVSQPTIQQIQVTPSIQQTTCTPLQTVSSVVTMATPSSTPAAVVQQQVTPVQTVVQAGTVTTQEALAAAQALPQSPQPPQVTIGNVTTVIQTQQPASKTTSTHYAMRTRNQPKH